MSKKILDPVSVTLTRSLSDNTVRSFHAIIKGTNFQSRIIVIVYLGDYSYDTYIEHDDNLDLYSLILVRSVAKEIAADLESGLIVLGFSS